MDFIKTLLGVMAFFGSAIAVGVGMAFSLGWLVANVGPWAALAVVFVIVSVIITGIVRMDY